MNKFYFLLVLVVVLTIALVSRWLLTQVETPSRHVSPSASHNPDYFMDNFKITVYQPNGIPAYYVDAQHMNHYPDDDTMTLSKLKIDYRDEQNQTWIATADKGTAYENIQVMHLNGNVHIWRETIKPNQTVLIRTNALRIDFPKKQATTDDEVKITSKNSTIVAKGMDINLAAGKLTLLSDARGHYVPN